MPNAYATATEVVARFPVIRGVLDVAESATVTSNAKLLSGINAANEIVDGILRDRYTLPLATVPDFLVHVACAITVQMVRMQRPDIWRVPEDRDILNALKEQLRDVSLDATLAVPPERFELSGSTTETGNASEREWVENF